MKSSSSHMSDDRASVELTPRMGLEQVASDLTPYLYEVPDSRTVSALWLHDEGMDVEAAFELASRDRSLVHPHRWMAVLAWIAGGLLIFFVVRDYALTPLYDIFAPSNMQEFADAVVLSGSVLWWTLVAISVVDGACRPVPAPQQRPVG